MLTHSQIWTAIDTLAQRHGLTPSALAKRAGLDATTFNRSKRQGADGHPRWPSTESIAKILAATGVGVDEFLAIITSEPGPSHLPFQFADHLTADAFDDDGALVDAELRALLAEHVEGLAQAARDSG